MKSDKFNGRTNLSLRQARFAVNLKQSWNNEN